MSLEFLGPASPVLAFLWGAVMASFTGVIVYRTPAWFGQRPPGTAFVPLHAPSRCEGCGRRLRAYELIPVLGWFLTKGHCFSCHHPIPARYPITEGFLGLLCGFAVCASHTPEGALYVCLLAPLLLLTAWFDWNESVVPDLFAALLAAAALIPGVILGRDALDMLAGGLLSAVIIGLAVWLPLVRRHGFAAATPQMPWGDVTLAVGLGCATGARLAPWFWLFAALLHIALFVLTQRGRRALARQRPLPMGPALCGGTALTLLAHITGVL